MKSCYSLVLSDLCIYGHTTSDPKTGWEVWILQNLLLHNKYIQPGSAVSPRRFKNFIFTLKCCSGGDTHHWEWVSSKGEREEEGEIDREVAHREYKRNKCQVYAGGRWIQIVSMWFPECEVIFRQRDRVQGQTFPLCSSNNCLFWRCTSCQMIPLHLGFIHTTTFSFLNKVFEQN